MAMDTAAAEPRRTPLGDAARSAVGPNRISAATKCRDVLIVIAAPFIIPAVLLAFTRYGPTSPFFESFTLGDVAFGFVSMAIAGVAKASTVKSDGWLAFTIGALIVIAFQTTLAIHSDNVADTKALVHVASAPSTQLGQHLSELKTLANNVQSKQPTLLSWIAALGSGAVIATCSFELIRRER